MEWSSKEQPSTAAAAEARRHKQDEIHDLWWKLVKIIKISYKTNSVFPEKVKEEEEWKLQISLFRRLRCVSFNIVINCFSSIASHCIQHQDNRQNEEKRRIKILLSILYKSGRDKEKDMHKEETEVWGDAVELESWMGGEG